MNVASQEKTTARLAACAAMWLWAGFNWVFGFWLQVAGYDDRIIGRVLDTTGAVGFFMMLVGLAMFLWGFQLAVWAVEIFRGKLGLAARLQRIVRGALVLGFCGTGAGIAFLAYLKLVRHSGMRPWLMLGLLPVGLLVLLAVTHEILRRAAAEEGRSGGAG